TALLYGVSGKEVRRNLRAVARFSNVVDGNAPSTTSSKSPKLQGLCTDNPTKWSGSMNLSSIVCVVRMKALMRNFVSNVRQPAQRCCIYDTATDRSFPLHCCAWHFWRHDCTWHTTYH